MPAGGWSEQGTPPPPTALQRSTRSAVLALLCGPHQQQHYLKIQRSEVRAGGSTALLALLCGISVLCSTSLASMPSSPVASGGAFGYSAERLDGCTADELKLLVKARGLPWPDRNDPARAARGRSVGSGLVKADFIAALMTPDGSAAPGPGPGPPVHHEGDIVEYDDPVSGRWLPAVVSGFNGGTGEYSVRVHPHAGTSVDASDVAADRLRAPPARRRTFVCKICLTVQPSEPEPARAPARVPTSRARARARAAVAAPAPQPAGSPRSPRREARRARSPAAAVWRAVARPSPRAAAASGDGRR